MTDGGDIFVFCADGKLESQTSVSDSHKPATLQYAYDGAPSRLREIKDPVSHHPRVPARRPGGDDGDRLAPAQPLACARRSCP
ncbi:hypothetical protein ACIQUM_41545 [Amycolatopsis azurea]|uniref:hypothetical protein n=1 Tax=Amycolatopsis azurea TaxID=36819 RepID=UPI0037F32999